MMQSRVKKYLNHLLIYCILVVMMLSISNWRDALDIHQRFFSTGARAIFSPGRDKESGEAVSSELVDERVLATKRILYWNPVLEYRFGEGSEPFKENGCPVTACEVTLDKSTVSDVDAVMIHTPHVYELPPPPLPHQTYIMVQEEPSMSLSEMSLEQLRGYFNLTMTYRRDSDITIPYAYEKRSVAFASLVDVDPLAKPKSVVWVVNECDTQGKREVYMQQLMKYIDVDTFGECGRYRCSEKNRTFCWKMFESTYRFYISFEAEVCRDYVTNIMYHPLRDNIIPIVYGGVNYTDYAPRDSVIDINNYPNPLKLAEYLKFLASDRMAYNEYFRWKRNGIFHDMNPHTKLASGMCKLCEILHEEDYKPVASYVDIKSWWADGTCNNTSMDTLLASWSS